jgi:hypothetical protein
MEYHPDHPRADKRGYVFAHIVAYENHTGTRVPEGFAVHHINGNKTDNEPENLIMLTVGEHSILHNKMRKLSEETKSKISAKAKVRLNDPSRHPLYISLDIDAIKSDRASGLTVKQICRKYGISRYTYYTRITDYRRK